MPHPRYIRVTESESGIALSYWTSCTLILEMDHVGCPIILGMTLSGYRARTSKRMARITSSCVRNLNGLSWR